MQIQVQFAKVLRDDKSQGFLECFIVVLFFDFCLYLHYGSSDCLVLNCLTFPLIFIYLYDDLSKNSIIQPILKELKYFYWILLIPLVAIMGLTKSYIPLFAACNVIVYFQMIRGVTHVFTAGEHYINAHILTSLFYFSFHSFSIESTIIYFSVLLNYSLDENLCLLLDILCYS